MVLKIFCIAVSGRPLRNPVAELLYQTAKEMWGEKAKKRRIKNDECVGVVTTKRQEVLLGDVAGVEFVADVETLKGKTRVRYIVRPNEFEDDSHAEWMSCGPSEDEEWSEEVPAWN